MLPDMGFYHTVVGLGWAAGCCSGPIVVRGARLVETIRGVDRNFIGEKQKFRCMYMHL